MISVNTKIKNKGFALTQIVLALALSSMVAIGAVAYYEHIENTKQTVVISDQVVQSAEKSKAEASTGIVTDNSTVINGISMSSANGVATLTSMDKSQCSALLASLNAKGTTTSSCSNSNPDLNSITFTPSATLLAAANNGALTAGTADVGATDTLNNPNMTGTTDVSYSNVNTGNASTGYTSTTTSGSTTSSLADGGNGTVTSGGVVTSPTTGSPSSYTGSSTMSCAYRLANDSAFANKSLGTRTMTCSTGYVSTSDQTGTESFSCPNPSAGVDPVSTDTWTGGSCALACIPLAEQTRDVGCPSGYLGNHYQHRDSSCPAPSGSPVWGSWHDYTGSNTCSIDTSCSGYPGESWNGSACQITCNTLKSEESPATGTETRAKPAADCPAGTSPTGNETRTYSYTCSSTFASPTKVYTSWSGGDCVAPATASATATQTCLGTGSHFPGGLCNNTNTKKTITNIAYDDIISPSAVDDSCRSNFNLKVGGITVAETMTCVLPQSIQWNSYAGYNYTCSNNYTVGGTTTTIYMNMFMPQINDGIGSDALEYCYFNGTTK